ncbi:MAG TPA: HEAT repeat domain-containing protein, partial [Anaerolineales bacterium]|nr:HEAT repeat domain-containing protein [Anaerolineales bacterium]
MPISSMPLPGDEEPPDASSQVAWLRSMGDREALFQIMEGDRRSIQGLEAAEALAQLGDVRGLDHLIAVANDAHSGLRIEAAEILQGLGHPRGLRALERRQTETQSSRTAAEREEIYEDLSAASTDELMAIWHENDRGGWTDLEFEVIEGILLERLGKLPRRAGDP